MCGHVKQTNKSYQNGPFFLAGEITLLKHKKKIKYCVVSNNFAFIFKHDGNPTKSSRETIPRYALGIPSLISMLLF